MGETIGNIFARTQESSVLEAVKRMLAATASVRTGGHGSPQNQLGGPEPVAYVSPCLQGWVGVFDALTETEEDPAGPALELSAVLETGVLAFRSDDGDYLHYVLAEKGELLDRYHSDPDRVPVCLSPRELRALKGNPDALCRVAGVSTDKTPALAKVLRRVTRRELTVMDGLEELGRLLGIPNISYTWAGMGSYPGDPIGWDEFTAVAWPELPSLSGCASQTQAEATFLMPKGVTPPGVQLPVEVVNRPPEGTLGDVWVWYPPPMSATDREHLVVHEAGAELSEIAGQFECVLWIDETPAQGSPFGRPTPRAFFVFSGSTEAARANLLRHYDMPKPEPGTLSPHAIPVLKRAMDGSLIRLWPPGTTKGSLKRKVTSDWVRYTLHNRCYEIRQDA